MLRPSRGSFNTDQLLISKPVECQLCDFSRLMAILYKHTEKLKYKANNVKINILSVTIRTLISQSA